MALQGTIDAFPLVDVLQLLSVSHKTGRLVIEGDRGTGSLWVADGALVGGELVPTTPSDPVELVFEILRFTDGSFLFEAGVEPTDASGHRYDDGDIPALLDGAGTLLEEWNAIVAVVPSTAHRVRPVDELPSAEVTVDAQEWAAIVAAAGASHMAGLASSLDLGEFEAARRVAGLVARGLVVVEEPATADLLPVPVEDPVPAGVDEPPGATVDGADALAVDPLLADVDEDEPFPERFPIDDLLGETEDVDGWGAPDQDLDRADRFAAAETYADDPAGRVGDPAEDAGTYVNPAFVDLGFGGTSYDEPGPVMDADPAFSDPAFSDPAFSDPGAGDAAAPAAFTDAAFTDAPFSDAGFTDAAFSAPAEPAQDPAVPASVPEAFDAVPAPASDGTDEVLRQMSKLSPKAAEAIAAALGTAAESDSEPPAEGGSPFLQSF